MSDTRDLTRALGEACTGYDLATVLTVLTYIVADACVQSNTDRDEFMGTFMGVVRNAIQDIEEDSNTKH